MFDVPLIRANRDTIKGYGEIVRDPRKHRIEIVPWPLTGSRKLDAGTGIEGGTAEGIFACEWRDNELIGRNEAVGGHYVIGFRDLPEKVQPGVALSRDRVLLWHCNYHPDGGQLFWPLDGKPFVVPVAKPGDDLKPEEFVAFWSDGSFGIYIHPGIWHEGVFPVGADRPLPRQAGQGACPRELRPRPRVRRAAGRAAPTRDLESTFSGIFFACAYTF